MEKGDIIILAQLLTAIRDAVDKMEIAYKRKSMEDLAAAKREIAELQSRIDKML